MTACNGCASLTARLDQLDTENRDLRLILGIWTDGLSTETVQQVWPAVLARVRAESRTLEAMLRGVGHITVDAGVVALAFRYEFHAHQATLPHHYGILQRVLSEELKRPVVIRCAVEREVAR